MRKITKAQIYMGGNTSPITVDVKDIVSGYYHKNMITIISTLGKEYETTPNNVLLIHTYEKE